MHVNKMPGGWVVCADGLWLHGGGYRNVKVCFFDYREEFKKFQIGCEFPITYLPQATLLLTRHSEV